MQVFKAFIKVIRHNWVSICLYICIFLLLAGIFSSLGNTPVSSIFMQTKSRIAVFNDDKGSAVSNGLVDYLKQNAVIVNLPDNRQSVQDALFYQDVVYIVRIPSGFGSGLTGGSKNIRLEKTTAAGSIDSINLDFLIKRYLSAVSLYTKNEPGISAAKVVQNVSKDLTQKADVELKAYDRKDTGSNVHFYFTYLAYALLAIIIIGVSSIMMTFNNPDLKKRNDCTPVRNSIVNLQLILGCLLFSLVVCVFLLAAAFALYGRDMLNRTAAMFCLNLLVFVADALSISFVAGLFIKNHAVMSAVSNVLSLGMSFISGVFVPQQLLGKTVQSISSFTPVYWYVKAINDLNGLIIWNQANLQPIVNCMLIEFAFAVAILAVGLVIARQRRAKSA